MDKTETDKNTDKSRAVFLDRDGVLIKEKHYLSNPEDVELIEGAAAALNLIHSKGYKAIVVSNQAGVARGFFKESDVVKVNDRILELLAVSGEYIDKFYYCPHHPLGKVSQYAVECSCRKPMPGMFHLAAEEFNIDLSESCMIGDKLSDIEAGINAGCKESILVTTGYGLKYKESHFIQCVKKNLLEAVIFFLNRYP